MHISMDQQRAYVSSTDPVTWKPGRIASANALFFARFDNDESWHILPPGKGWVACGLRLNAGTQYQLTISSHHPDNADICSDCVRNRVSGT
jgi:hypothetical protein